MMVLAKLSATTLACRVLAGPRNLVTTAVTMIRAQLPRGHATNTLMTVTSSVNAVLQNQIALESSEVPVSWTDVEFAAEVTIAWTVMMLLMEVPSRINAVSAAETTLASLPPPRRKLWLVATAANRTAWTVTESGGPTRTNAKELSGRSSGNAVRCRPN